MIQSLARFLMGLAPAIPDPNDPTLRERFNLREFREASDIDRRRFMMAIARSRYESECEMRSEEHTSELQSRLHLVCRLLLEKKKHSTMYTYTLIRTQESASSLSHTS